MSENVDPNIPVGDGENGGEPVGNGTGNGIVDNIGGGESNQSGGTAEGGGIFDPIWPENDEDKHPITGHSKSKCKCDDCNNNIGNGGVD